MCWIDEVGERQIILRCRSLLRRIVFQGDVASPAYRAMHMLSSSRIGPLDDATPSAVGSAAEATQARGPCSKDSTRTVDPKQDFEYSQEVGPTTSDTELALGCAGARD